MEIKYDFIFEYLCKGMCTFPDGSSDNSKRVIRSKAKKFSTSLDMRNMYTTNVIRERGSVLYLGMALECWDFAIAWHGKRELLHEESF